MGPFPELISRPRRASISAQRTGAVGAFAREVRDKEKGKWFEAPCLGGFCLLVKRDVLQRVGSREAWPGLALFDTDWLSAKARQAGYSLACCRDLFMHHFGTRAFAHGAPAGSATQGPAALAS
jgi:GT2 family glycosyltransferase